MTQPLENDDDDVEEVEEVWNELRLTKEPRHREILLIRLAECALVDHDFSDLEIPDYVHEAFGKMRAVQAKYEVTALALGRMVAQYMETTVLLPHVPDENPN